MDRPVRPAALLGEGPKLRHSRPHHRARRVSAALVAVVMSAGIGLFLASDHAYVTTPSMYPTIPPGAMVFVAKQPAYHVGEVIEFRGTACCGSTGSSPSRTASSSPRATTRPQRPTFSSPARTMIMRESVVVSVPFLGLP